MEAFMRFKNALGQCYQRGSHTLRRFDRYVAAQYPQGGRLDWPALVSGWLGDRPARKPITVLREMTVLRQFCLFQRRAHAAAFVPDTQWVSPAALGRFTAYPLSSSQVAELIRRTQDLEDLPLRRRGIRALLCLLYSTGLRLGEALRLQCVDVDWEEQRFFIRMSKGRSRWVPFRKDLLRELNKYREEREQHLQESPKSFLLCRADGSAYSVACVSVTIRQLMRQAGFKPAQGRVGPRPHDLRHHSERLIIPSGA
jgi:integrase/recombinase XerD